MLPSCSETATTPRRCLGCAALGKNDHSPIRVRQVLPPQLSSANGRPNTGTSLMSHNGIRSAQTPSPLGVFSVSSTASKIALHAPQSNRHANTGSGGGQTLFPLISLRALICSPARSRASCSSRREASERRWVGAHRVQSIHTRSPPCLRFPFQGCLVPMDVFAEEAPRSDRSAEAE